MPYVGYKGNKTAARPPEGSLVKTRYLKGLKSAIVPFAEPRSGPKSCSGLRSGAWLFSGKNVPIFANVSHQTRLDTRSKARRAIKVGINLKTSDCLEDTSETPWGQLKSAILQKSEEVQGFTTKNKDWFNENNQEIQELLAKKRSFHQAHLDQPSCSLRMAVFYLICCIPQCKLREIQNESGVLL